MIPEKITAHRIKDAKPEAQIDDCPKRLNSFHGADYARLDWRWR